MRRSLAALALIRRDQNGRTDWLAQWNRNWQAYAFVGGHKYPDESFRDCVVREIGEELGLAEGHEFEVAADPTAHLEYQAWSKGAQQETAYTLELFEVQLTGDDAYRKINSNPHNRWLDADEIRNTGCRDGQPVSDTLGRFLNAIGTRP